MKKNFSFKKALAVAILFILFNSCDKLKKENNTVYTLTGHIYADCGMVPLSNQTVSLYQQVEGSGLGGSSSDGGELAITTTDANGYFKFEYKDDYGGLMSIRTGATAGYVVVMNDIPRKLNENNLVLYKYPTTNIQVNLNVINPHTVNDTLVIGNFTATPLQLAGPFTSGILYTKTNYNTLIMYYDGKEDDIGWYFKNDISQSFRKSYKIDKYCDNTIYITCDIN